MAQRNPINEFNIADWTVSPRSGSISKNGKSSRVGPNVIEVLLYLVRNRGEIVSREEIFASVWPGIAVSDDVLTQSITALRKAFEDSSRNSRIIRTYPKRGYALIADVSKPEPPHIPAPARITRLTLEGGAKREPRISPDGNKVAYVWSGKSRNSWDIYIKPIGTGTEISRITDDPFENRSPVWSPDGKQIAFVRVPPFQTPPSPQKAAIFLVPSCGGPEKKLLDISGEVFANEYFLPMLAWTPDGKYLAFSCLDDEETPARILMLNINSLELSALTCPPEGTMGDYAPEFSPDGREIVFVNIGSDLWGNQDLWIHSIDTGLRRQLTSQGYVDVSQPVWPKDLDIIYYFSHMGVSMIDSTGGMPRLVPGLGRGAGELSVNRNRIVYVERFGTETAVYRVPGRRHHQREQEPKRLFSGMWPKISPDGKKITYSSDRTGLYNIWISDTDGSNPVQITDSRISSGAPSWSPDSKRLAFDSSDFGKGDLFTVDLKGGPIRRITSGPAANMAPTWSNDGKWLYFRSTRTGRSEIWKIPAEGGPVEQVTLNGGYYAIESLDGNHLYFTRSKISGLWRVPVPEGPEELVLERKFLYSHWAISKTGVYFSSSRDTGQLRDYSLNFFDFQCGEIKEIIRNTGEMGSGWIDVSPDEDWIACTHQHHPDSELILVENFFP